MTSSDDSHHRPDHTYAPLPPGVRVCDDEEAAGDYFFYQDGELIVPAADYPLVERLLAEWEFDRNSFMPTRSEVGAGLMRVRVSAFPRGLDTVQLVRSLRATEIRDEGYAREDERGRRRSRRERRRDRRPEGPPARPRGRRADLPARPPRVSFNHVLGVHTHTIWGSAVPPRPSPALAPLPVGENLPGAGVRVGVLDTGIFDHEWLRGRWTAVNGLPYGEVEDATWVTQGELEYQVGHGTFIAGTVLRHAPSAEVVVERMRNRNGCVDDWTVHSFLPHLLDARNPVDVLNLSFGGRTWDNRPLPAVCTVLDAFLDAHPEVVVVASAGNEGDTRPVWPAALPRVVGVGALTTGDRGQWPQSNSGSWVDAWTVGVDLPGPFVRWPHTPPPDTGPLQRPPNYALPWPAPRHRFEGWAIWSGTSFAAARVSGAIAAQLKRDSRTPGRVVFDLIDNAATRYESGAVVSPADFS